MPRFALTLLSALLLVRASAASARTVPSCPVGSKQSTWKGSRGDNRYNCKLSPVTKDAHGLEQCLEWEGTHWSSGGVTVPCGSTVSSVSDSDQPHSPNSDQPNPSIKTPAETRAAIEANEAKKAAEAINDGSVLIHLKITAAKWVTVGETDRNGYEHNKSRPIQRLVGTTLESVARLSWESASPMKLDILCYGMGRYMDNCPILQVGTTYKLHFRNINLGGYLRSIVVKRRVRESSGLASA